MVNLLFSVGGVKKTEKSQTAPTLLTAAAAPASFHSSRFAVVTFYSTDSRILFRTGAREAKPQSFWTPWRTKTGYRQVAAGRYCTATPPVPLQPPDTSHTYRLISIRKNACCVPVGQFSK